MALSRVPLTAVAGRAATGDRGEQVAWPRSRSSIWRGQNGQGGFQDYQAEVERRHGRARRRARDSGEAGQRSRLPLELQGRQMRLVLGRDQRQAQADVHDAAGPAAGRPADHGRADARVPARQGPRDRRLVELRGQEADQGVHAAQARRAGRHLAHAAGRHRPRPGIPEVHRVLLCARTSVTSCATTTSTASSSARASSSTRPRSRCTRSTPPTASPSSRTRSGIGYCNITKCCTKVCPEHITITDNAIIPLKERVVDRFYDPISRLLRVISGRS